MCRQFPNIGEIVNIPLQFVKFPEPEKIINSLADDHHDLAFSKSDN